MARGVPLKEFASARFLRELHHLLWLDADTLAAGTVDAGWNCRDHALMAALLLKSFGRSPLLVHGEALFVRGACGGSACVTVTQRPHTWILLDGVGAIDLSIKPDFVSCGERFRLGLDGVFANDWLPRGKGRAYFLDDPAAFARAMDELPQRRNHATAVYLAREAEHLHEGHVRHSAGWIRSPLTHWLDANHGDPVPLYAALLLHLRDFLLRDAPSFAGRPAHDAWRALARSTADTVERAIACIGADEPQARERGCYRGAAAKRA